MKNFCLLIILLCSYHIKAQVTFQKLFVTGIASSTGLAKQTHDNGYIRMGTLGSQPMGCIYLVKSDSVGNTQWFKYYDSLYNFATSRAVFPCHDGGYIMAGDVTDSDTSGNGSDAFLIKTNDTGKVLWQRRYGGRAYENIFSAIETDNRGFILVGTAGSLGMYIIKTDSMGVLSWTKTYGDTVNYIPIGRFITQTGDGSYIIAGEAPTGTLPNAFCLMKIDSVGNFLWGKAYGGIYPEKLFAFDAVSDGGYIMGGDSYSFNTNHNTKDAYLIKTDSAGNVAWAKTYSKPIYYSSFIFKILETRDSGFIASVKADTFGVDQDIVILKINNAGNTEWSKKIGQPNLNEGGTVAGQNMDGGYTIIGALSSFSIPATFGYSYLVKTDSLGNSGCYTDTFSFAVADAPPIVTNISFTLFGTLDSSSTLTSSTTIHTGTDSTLCFNNGSNAVHEIPALQKEVSVFPNPTTGIINIEANGVINLVKITNAMGAIIYSSNPQTEKTSINLSHKARGIYFYTVQMGDRTERGKIMLE